MRRGGVLVAVLALGAGAIGFLFLTAKGEGLRTEAREMFATLSDELAEFRRPAAERPERAERPVVSRTSVESGRAVVRLTDEERDRIGVETARLEAKPHAIEIQAYGGVLDLARVTELTNSYANAKAQLQTAEAKAEVSRSAFQRARSLGTYTTKAQLETAEGAARTDEAALAAAQSQLRTLSATAQQEWGPVIGKAIVDRSPLITRLIERADFLMQVTLPPGETLRAPPSVAFAEVPPQSERISLRYVSTATRSDQRIQGVSYFYSVAGDSGLLPGMSTLAFLTSDRMTTGVLVPESAVVHWQGSAWIYRRVDDDAFTRHLLKPDAPISADGFVIDDLGPEADVVTVGPQAVLSEEVKGLAPGADEDDD